MEAVSQNYRGLGNQPVVRGLLDLQKAEDPDILFLSETKLLEKEMERFRWMLNMPNMIMVDCVGRSGGLALFSRKGVEVNQVEGKVSHRC
jgi:exonuclease III